MCGFLIGRDRTVRGMFCASARAYLLCLTSCRGPTSPP